MKKKAIIWSAVLLLLLVGVWWAWGRYASPTRVALVNFQKFQTTSIVKANTDPFVKYEEVSIDEVEKLRKFDFVMGFGMGMKMTVEQREKLVAMSEKGLPVYIYAATSPENNISSLDSLTQEGVSAYFKGGDRRNYENMAKYIRQNIDNKKLFVTPADSATATISDALYHLDEEVAFETVAEYEAYLREHSFYKNGAAKVAIIGGMNSPFSGNREHTDSLIVSLERSGLNVYPVASAMKRLDYLRAIRPDAVIYFPHGRLAMGQADAAVEWLKEVNIPIFAPLTVLQSQQAWEDDQMGLFGGFMSQSVVMPELDGAIYPYVVTTQEVDDDGLSVFKAIPKRLKAFTQIVNNFIELKRKRNGDKKVAIYFFKGAGQESLTAQGLETVPSLYNLLKRLGTEGYKVDNLPASVKEFEAMLMKQGAVLSTYAEGVFDDYLKSGNPALVEKSEYESWVAQSLPKELYANVTDLYGEAPGGYMSVEKGGKSYLAVARIEMGNIALLPQPMAGLGDDAFAIVHGAKSAPPHSYIGAYLWSQHAFGADAMVHFGAHGSLEFTPQKQVALSDNDWADRLVGTIPHLYYYTIGNVGESMMAKRRSYATTISYLTPPFMESKTRSQFKELQDKIRDFYRADEQAQPKASLAVKKITIDMGLHRELRMDSIPANPYTLQEVERIENFAEEIANEKITGQLYTSGVPYEKEKIRSSVLAMSVDPIAYSLAALDKQRGEVTEVQLKRRSLFSLRYLDPARALVNQVLSGRAVSESFICGIAKISPSDLAQAREVLAPKRPMMGKPKAAPMDNTSMAKPTAKPMDKEMARAIVELERSINNITAYRQALEQSPQMEFASILNALSGGYIAPSSGGDAVANPNAAPTGRNLYAINAEATPSEAAWDKGVALVGATLEHYKKEHGDYPRKVSYTFWSSEFIESEGTTIAQVLYMLGVEPVRDGFGRVSDLQLIGSETLGRPRIDVVVQTSGQFRDLAASRLSLISRAVKMAAEAGVEKFDNYVSNSTIETERLLVEQGVSPKNARALSTQRIFGGVNGMYGTGIQEMVSSGDKWEDDKEIADTYIQNMGAVYGGDEDWGEYHGGLLRAVLHNTDVVVQPRQSNTWGALSLDHVYEFMGGMNLAVRDVTGKDPKAYFADYRNRNGVKMQELKEAIGVESRATIFNPEYIKEVMKGSASSASQITEVVNNTFGWNVMKPDVIDKQMWDNIYDVYIKDSHNLGIRQFFKAQNQAALQEITAVMMESSRKGMWKASPQQLSDIAQLHIDLVKEFGAKGSGFAGANAKLQDFIAQKVSPQNAQEYKGEIDKALKASSESIKDGMVLKKNASLQGEEGKKSALNGVLIVSVVLIAFVLLLVILRRKRRNN